MKTRVADSRVPTEQSVHGFVYILDMWKRLLVGILAAILLAVGAFFLGVKVGLHPENQKPGKFPEQLVFVRSVDDVVSGGVRFTPPKESSRTLTIIWVHGWGANFYTPS